MLLDFVFRNSFRIYILYIYYSEETRKKQVPFLKQSSSTIPSEAQTATTAAQIAEHVRQTDFQAQVIPTRIGIAISCLSALIPLSAALKSLQQHLVFHILRLQCHCLIPDGLCAAAGGQRESARRRARAAHAQGRRVFKERPRPGRKHSGRGGLPGARAGRAVCAVVREQRAFCRRAGGRRVAERVADRV